MIYLTGDIHGEVKYITGFCMTYQPRPTDCIMLLGDVGANYHRDQRDSRRKESLNRHGVTILCIHGNHEQRPAGIPSYKMKEWNGGQVWYEEEYPNLLFAKDGEIYTIAGKRFIAIGGAYSVDKPYRVSNKLGWWPDEQPSEEIKRYVEKQLSGNRIDYVLPHTCPFRYEPTERFMPGVDQSKVDSSTEKWLGQIEANLDYNNKKVFVRV